MPIFRSIDDFERVLGRDLRLDYASSPGFYEDGDLVPTYRPTPTRDSEATQSFEGLVQALVNRLKTRKGELEPLGHPEYGSRHHELIGEPNTERVRALIKLFVLQALRHEARVEKVLDCKVLPDHDPPRDTVRIELRLQIIAASTPLNLVVPFGLGGPP